MHFDEVYHARTAAEFLQDWRYGISHYIYEWTHPHLAKYAMAGGIVLFAGHDTAATSELGTPVRDAAIEPRRPDPDSATARDGDRVWVVTGSALSGYDLETRKLVGDLADRGRERDHVRRRRVPAVRRHGRRRDAGARHDAARRRSAAAGPNDLPFQPESVATLDGSISRLATFDGGQSLAALLPDDTIADDTIAIVDPGTGEVTGSAVIADAVDMTDSRERRRGRRDAGGHRGPGGRRRQAGRDPGRGRRDLRAAAVRDRPGPGDHRAAPGGGPAQGVRRRRRRREPRGRQHRARARAGRGRLGRRHAADASGTTVATVPLDGGGAHGLALVSGVEDGTQLYATSQTGTSGDPELAIIAVTGKAADAGPDVIRTMPLPGAGTRVVFDAASEMVEVLGTTQDGSGTHGLRRRDPQPERVRRPARPVHAGRAGARPQRGLPDGRTAASCWPSRRTVRPARSTSATTRSRGGCRACSWAP